MKINQEKLDKYRDDLERLVRFYYKDKRIKTYEDLFRILCNSLSIGIYNVDVIEYPSHIIIISNYDFGYDHKAHVVTYIYHRNEVDIENDTNSLEIILENKDEDKIIDGLMDLCITMLDNMVNPYNNTGDLAPVN